MTTDDTIAANTTRFWEICEPLMGGAVAEGTMMGSPCLRVDGEFTAMIHSTTGELIVKLAADDVAAEIASGAGSSFAPNGRIFKEWLLVTADDDAAWHRLVRAAVDHAS